MNEQPVSRPVTVEPMRREFSFVPGGVSGSPVPKPAPLGNFVKAVKEGKWAKQIRDYRSGPLAAYLRAQAAAAAAPAEGKAAAEDAAKQAKDKADAAKRKLPAVTPGGVFQGGHARGDLVKLSGLMVLDFDGKDNPGFHDHLDDVKRDLGADPHTLAVFVSPGGEGLKAIVPTAIDDASGHEGAYRAAVAHYAASYGLKADESGKDVSRLCFVSHDPEIIAKESAAPFAPAAAAPAVVAENATTRAAPTRPGPGPADAERRALAYLDAMPPAVSGEHGHDALYNACVALVVGFALPPARAEAIVRERYNPRCSPPWGDKEIAHKIADAAKNEKGLAVGYLLGAPRPSPAAAPRPPLAAPAAAASLPTGTPPEPWPRLDPDAPQDGYEFPAGLLECPGEDNAINEIAAHIDKGGHVRNKALSFFAALAAFAYCTDRKLVGHLVGETDVYANLFFILMGSSGVGKTDKQKRVLALLREMDATESAGLVGGMATPDELAQGRYFSKGLHTEAASGEGIEDALLQHPNALLMWDEFQQFLMALANGGDPLKANVAKALRKAFSAAGSVMQRRTRARNATNAAEDEKVPRHVFNPHLTALACGIKKHVAGAFAAPNSPIAEDGTAARFLTIEGRARAESKPGADPAYKPWPPALIDRLLLWHRAVLPGGGSPDAPAVTARGTAEARQLMAELKAEAEAKAERAARDEDLRTQSVWERWEENVSKLAMVSAAGRRREGDQGDVPIEAADVQWAAAVVSECIGHYLQLLEEWGSRDAAMERDQGKILRALVSYVKAHGGDPNRAPCPRAILQSRSHIKADEGGKAVVRFDRALDDLIVRRVVQCNSEAVRPGGDAMAKGRLKYWLHPAVYARLAGEAAGNA